MVTKMALTKENAVNSGKNSTKIICKNCDNRYYLTQSAIFVWKLYFRRVWKKQQARYQQPVNILLKTTRSYNIQNSGYTDSKEYLFRMIKEFEKNSALLVENYEL